MIIASQAEPNQSPRADVPKAGLIYIKLGSPPRSLLQSLFDVVLSCICLCRGNAWLLGCSNNNAPSGRSMPRYCTYHLVRVGEFWASQKNRLKNEKVKILGLVCSGMRFVQSSRRRHRYVKACVACMSVLYFTRKTEIQQESTLPRPVEHAPKGQETLGWISEGRTTPEQKESLNVLLIIISSANNSGLPSFSQVRGRVCKSNRFAEPTMLSPFVLSVSG